MNDIIKIGKCESCGNNRKLAYIWDGNYCSICIRDKMNRLRYRASELKEVLKQLEEE